MRQTKRPGKKLAWLGYLALDLNDGLLIREALHCWKNDAHLDGCTPEYEAWIDEMLFNLDAAMAGVQHRTAPALTLTPAEAASLADVLRYCQRVVAGTPGAPARFSDLELSELALRTAVLAKAMARAGKA